MTISEERADLAQELRALTDALNITRGAVKSRMQATISSAADLIEADGRARLVAGVDVAELRRLLAEATARPWEMSALGLTWTVRVPDHSIGVLFGLAHEQKRNGELIVAAVNTLPALLDIAEQHRPMSEDMSQCPACGRPVSKFPTTEGGGSDSASLARGPDNATPAPGSPGGPVRAPREIAEEIVNNHLILGDSDEDDALFISLTSAIERAIIAERAAWPASEKLSYDASIADLQAEIGRLQDILHRRVLGDPRESVSAQARQR